uniref:Uncharacterized protein n=1 Tax=Anas platyrhynchos TaxID=8839 RepID=A0A8B9TY85_ANAPL
RGCPGPGKHSLGIKKGCGEDPRLSLPLLLRHDQLGQVGVQLVLLVDPLLLDAVPALLLGDAQRAGDVVPEVQPLLLGQVGDGLVVALHLHLALPQEEMRLDRLPVQLQRPLAVRQRLVVLLHLQVAQRPVGVVHGHQGGVPGGVPGLTHDGPAVGGGGLGVLAAPEEAVALLLVLLRAVALLRASSSSAAASPRGSRPRSCRRGAPAASSASPGPRRAALPPLLLPLHGPARPRPCRPPGAAGSAPAAAAHCDSAASASLPGAGLFKGAGKWAGLRRAGGAYGIGRRGRVGVVNLGGRGHHWWAWLSGRWAWPRRWAVTS